MSPARILSLPVPLIGGLYICLHVLLDWASFVHPFGNFGITPWNPSTGLIFVLVIFLGLRALPYVIVALILANLAVRGAPVSIAVAFMETLIVAAGYTVALIGLMSPGLHFNRSLPSTRDLLLLLGAAALGSAVVAAVYLGMLFQVGLLSQEDLLAAGLRYWVGDMIGIAIVAPFGLLLLTRERLLLLRWELAPQIAFIILTIWMAIAFAEHSQLHLFYLLFLPIIWVVVRSGLEGVSATLVLVQIGLFVAVQVQGRTIDITDFQYRMLVLAVTGLIAGALVTERRHAE